MKKKSIAVVVALAAILAVNCKPQRSAQTNEIKGHLVFLKGEVTVNNKEARMGLQVQQDDVIETGKKSAATIQFPGSALIKLKASTKLEVRRLLMGADKPEIGLVQAKGNTFNKIVKGQADYNLSTPTAVAGVRGTTFSVKVNNKDNATTVRLLEGKVAVKTSASETQEEPVMLEAGKKVVIGEEAKTKQIKVQAIEDLATDEKVDLADESKEETVLDLPQIEELVKKEEPKQEDAKKDEKTDEKQVEKKQEPKKLTLADLKAKYGRLSKIILKSGQEYIGAFQQKGAEMIIITVDGRFKHKPSDIERVLPHNI